MGITIVAANPNLFATLKPWIPSLGQRLQTQEILSGAQFAPIETDTSIGYMISLDGGQQI